MRISVGKMGLLIETDKTQLPFGVCKLVGLVSGGTSVHIHISHIIENELKSISWPIIHFDI